MKLSKLTLIALLVIGGVSSQTDKSWEFFNTAQTDKSWEFFNTAQTDKSWEFFNTANVDKKHLAKTDSLT